MLPTRASPRAIWPALHTLFAFIYLLITPCIAVGADPLAKQVTIYRDTYGVPHIVGETEEATFFGYGYAQAQDHLERMMMQYRDAQGRRAEVLGESAMQAERLEFVEKEYRWGGDYLQRLFRAKKDVISNRDKIDPNVYTILSSFARGVNEYIGENRQRIPAWIDGVSPEDIEALERSNYLRFYSLHDALQKLDHKPYKFARFGSNHWAISQEKSVSGHIIHVEHNHMPWGNHFQNYEAHLITPNKLYAAGISWFGSPFFLMGFNDKVTWSATWNQPNISDVYVERINPKDQLQYLYDGRWRPVSLEWETFRVKTGAGFQDRRLPLYYTSHGPVVHFDRTRNIAYSVKLPNADGVNYSKGLYEIMKARNLEEFKAALSHQLIPRWNFLYSDTKNIFWVHNALVAQRSTGYDWTKPVPGWTSKTEWGSFLPFSMLPQALNPKSGFLQNCNNPPWVVTTDSNIQPLEPTPYYLQVTPSANAGREVMNTRAERMFQVLEQDKKFTLDEMKELAFDTYIVPTDVIIPLLDKAFAPLLGLFPYSTDERVLRALKLIRRWDRRSSIDSIAFTYFYYWGRAYEDLYSEKSFSRFLGNQRHGIDINSWWEQRRARIAFEAAVDRIQAHFGKTEVPWGSINVALRGGAFMMDGNGLYDVLHPDSGPEQPDGTIHNDDGWGHLMVVVESQPKRIWSLLPYGQSEDPASPHYNDQSKLHSERKLKRFWFSAQEILDNNVSVWGDSNRLRRLRDGLYNPRANVPSGRD